jgi:hypothetical protein
MKKIGLIVLCLSVLVGTILIFLPDNISAEGWWCYWYPYEDCTEIGGIVVVTHCNRSICDFAGTENQICVYCQIDDE